MESIHDPVFGKPGSYTDIMDMQRKVVHILTIFLALLLRYLSPAWTALLVFATLLFNFFVIPRMMRSVYRSQERGLDAGIVLFPVSLLLLVILFGQQMEVVAGAWALLAVGDGFATLIGQILGDKKLPWNRQKSWAGLIAFVLFGAPAVIFMMSWVGTYLSLPVLIVVALLITLASALVESLDLPLNDNLTVPLIGGGLLYFASISAEFTPVYWQDQVTPYLLYGGLCINAGGALLAYFFNLLTPSGVVAASIVGTILFLFQPWAWPLLVIFFAAGSGVSRLGAMKKYSSSTELRRGASQVLAKGLAPVLFAFLSACGGYPELFLIALTASIAAALADTVESELGRLLGAKPFLPTTFEPVPPGTPGAVSLEGTLLGVAASTLVAVTAVFLRLIDPGSIPLILIASFAGTFLESYLGANQQRRSHLKATGLNFISTMVSGLAGMLLYWML